MKNSLKTIQVLAQIGRVLSKIVWICCIVGAAGSLIGIVSLAAGVGEIFKIGGVTIYGMIVKETGMSVSSMYASMAVAMILCLGEIVTALFAERYFKNELKAGTPFTFAGADELKRLGIIAICVSVGTSVLAEVVYQVIDAFSRNVESMNINAFDSVGLGIAFLVMSVVFRCGAEQIANNKNT